jgi:hypothetical protein
MRVAQGHHVQPETPENYLGLQSALTSLAPSRLQPVFNLYRGQQPSYVLRPTHCVGDRTELTARQR